MNESNAKRRCQILQREMDGSSEGILYVMFMFLAVYIDVQYGGVRGRP